MSVLSKLSSALNQRGEAANIDLTKSITAKKDRTAIRELVENLNNKNKAMQSDCIKVLYEIGEMKPELIAEYAAIFGKLLKSKNNRLVWGAMTALDMVTSYNTKAVYKMLPEVLQVADEGTVITRDHAVGILVKLCFEKAYFSTCFKLLLEQLKMCPTNQFPMYAEMISSVVNDASKKAFVTAVSSRIGDLQKESQIKRIEKLLKKLAKT